MVALRDELAKPDRGGKPRRTRADDPHVELHGFALDRRLVHPSVPVPPPAGAAGTSTSGGRSRPGRRTARGDYKVLNRDSPLTLRPAPT